MSAYIPVLFLGVDSSQLAFLFFSFLFERREDICMAYGPAFTISTNPLRGVPFLFSVLDFVCFLVSFLAISLEEAGP